MVGAQIAVFMTKMLFFTPGILVYGIWGLVLSNIMFISWFICFPDSFAFGCSTIQNNFIITSKVELLLLWLSASYVLHLFFCCSKWHMGSVQAAVLISQNIPSWDVGSGICEYETTLKCTSGLHCLSVNLCYWLCFISYKSAVVLDFSCFLEAHSKCFRVLGFSLGPVHLPGENSDSSNGKNSWQLMFFEFHSHNVFRWTLGSKGLKLKIWKSVAYTG